MKNLKSLFMIMLALVALTLASCEGPAGKDGATGAAGKDGVNGKDGKDGIAGCIQCHGDPIVENIQGQYKLSMHGEGEVWIEEAGRAACGACHQGSGFAEAVTLGTLDPVKSFNNPIDCKTCHTIHTKYDNTDFALRLTSAIQLRENDANPTEKVDFKGSGNTCARCHQARIINRNNPAGFDTLTASLDALSGKYFSRLGPHYGMASNIMAWKGLQDFGTALTVENNPHGSISCVTCHMGTDTANLANGGHTFKMTASGLANMIDKQIKENKNSGCACHGDATATKKIRDGVMTKAIGTDIGLIRKKFDDGKYLLIPTDASLTDAQKLLGEYFMLPNSSKMVINKDTASMIMNYFYINKDRSKGIHNPPMVKAMTAKLKAALGL